MTYLDLSLLITAISNLISALTGFFSRVYLRRRTEKI